MCRCGGAQSTEWVRASSYVGPSIPLDLLDRRVELTCPVSRRMLLHALNSGARVVMADFEDSTSPTWLNVIEGQINVRDAVHRRISHQADDQRQPQLQLTDHPATLMVRPRGWHFDEAHIQIDGSVHLSLHLTAHHSALECCCARAVRWSLSPPSLSLRAL